MGSLEDLHNSNIWSCWVGERVVLHEDIIEGRVFVLCCTYYRVDYLFIRFDFCEKWLLGEIFFNGDSNGLMMYLLAKNIDYEKTK